jgi:formylglycine-generating enzyme required for sulfatase activity
MDKYKVTNAEYCRFLNDGNPAYWSPPGKQYWYPQLPDAITRDKDGRFVVELERSATPVTGISWYQAAGYAEWAGKRLPTEAEREFAAGGKHGFLYPWGNEPPDLKRAHINTGMRSVPGDIYPKGASPEGVFDLMGNGAEWVADYFDQDYYAKAPPGGLLESPTGPAHGVAEFEFKRMIMGWCRCPDDDSAKLLQHHKRHPRGPLHTDSSVGFRCVKSGCD